MRMHDLAHKTVISRGNVTRLADRLEKAGLVARTDCPEDGRGTVCELTAKGRALRARMWPVYRREIESRFGRHLSIGEARTLAAAFERILQKNREMQ
jgi:DNA-binding MarR family transcriptional regulator